MQHSESSPPSFYHYAWAIAARIPPGRVMTYGQIATLIGSPRAARAVGYAMFFVKNDAIPWHRVINAKGGISLGGHVDRPLLQRELLAAEGVVLDAEGRVDLQRYLWWPDEESPS